jgi:hypothetical protein
MLGADRVRAKGVFRTSAREVFLVRYLQLRSLLVKLICDHPEIEAVGVESPPFGESWSPGLYALFVYVNEAVYLCRRDVVFFDPSTVKMLAKLDPSVRRGKMDKQDMKEAAKADTGVRRWTHDEADAYLIARSAAWFWSVLDGSLEVADLTPSEKSSFFRMGPQEQDLRPHHRGLVSKEGQRFFRFSKVPVDPNEEGLKQWLLGSCSAL